MFLVNTINKFIKNGEERTVKVKKNILVSFFIRVLSVGINFSIVPLTIAYVSSVQYGIWLTLVSVISWFTFVDFGMGNGLRNKLTTAIAFKEYDKAKKYISTTYILLAIIALVVFVLFFFINPFINWNNFLNIPSTENIHLILLIVLGVFCIQFTAQLLNIVLVSLQEPAMAEFITLLGQAALLLTLIILKYTVAGSLSVLVLALNIAPAFVLVLVSLLLYNGKLKEIAPSLKSVDFSYARNILNVGGAFFLIQLGALILFQTDNIIIARILGPESVTKFNVTYKLYSVIIMVFSIIANPYWSAFTDAYAKKDYQWIAKSIKRLRDVWLFISVVIIPLFFCMSKLLFKIWLQDSVTINAGLSMLMSAYVMCYTCLALNCYFLNGVGKLKLQLILYLPVIIINVPLGIVMGKLWGIEGVIISNLIIFVFMNIILWIQTNKLMQQKASGIWDE